jgi:hypothetical protein
MKLPAHNRYDYVPINRREDYTWPGGKRLAVYFCNNIEYFAFGTASAPTRPAARRHRRSATTRGATTATASASGACSTSSTSSPARSPTI